MPTLRWGNTQVASLADVALGVRAYVPVHRSCVFGPEFCPQSARAYEKEKENGSELRRETFNRSSKLKKIERRYTRPI